MARVLIAEPSAEVRALLALAVLRTGHEPLLHDHRSERTGWAVDVLLLEPALRGGLELAHALRSARPKLPIVICSIFPPSAALHVLAPVAHVEKPFQRDALERALRAAVAAVR